MSFFSTIIGKSKLSNISFFINRRNGALIYFIGYIPISLWCINISRYHLRRQNIYETPVWRVGIKEMWPDSVSKVGENNKALIQALALQAFIRVFIFFFLCQSSTEYLQISYFEIFLHCHTHLRSSTENNHFSKLDKAQHTQEGPTWNLIRPSLCVNYTIESSGSATLIKIITI